MTTHQNCETTTTKKTKKGKKKRILNIHSETQSPPCWNLFSGWVSCFVGIKSTLDWTQCSLHCLQHHQHQHLLLPSTNTTPLPASGCRTGTSPLKHKARSSSDLLLPCSRWQKLCQNENKQHYFFLACHSPETLFTERVLG